MNNQQDKPTPNDLPVIHAHEYHYAVVETSGAIKGFTWTSESQCCTHLPSKQAAYNAAVEYAKHGYVPSWDKLSAKPTPHSETN